MSTRYPARKGDRPCHACRPLPFSRRTACAGRAAEGRDFVRRPAGAAGRRGAAIGGLARSPPPRRAADPLRRRSARLRPARRDRRRPSATTRWSSSAARRARANRPNCRKSAWSWAAAIDGLIGHTQPRRIAARSVAARIADELASPLGPRRRLQGPLRRGPLAADLHQADDRRHPPGRNPGRPVPRPVRYDHPRRSPRAVAEYRLSDRLPEAAAAEAARSEADRYLGHDRRRPLRRPFRHAPRSRAGGRSLRADVSGRSPLAAAAGRRRRRRARLAAGRARGRRGGRRHRPGRHPHLHADRAAHPRDGQDAPRPAAARRSQRAAAGDPAALRPAVDARAAACVSTGRETPRRHRHERGRVVADRAADSLRDRSGHGADQPLLAAQQDATAADRAGLPGVGRPAQGPLRAHRAGHLRAALQRRRLRRPRRLHARRRSSGPIWPP